MDQYLFVHFLSLHNVPAQPAGGPYGGTAATIPGLIEAEEFDYGGEGVGYSDSTPNNIQGVGGRGRLAREIAGAP